MSTTRIEVHKGERSLFLIAVGPSGLNLGGHKEAEVHLPELGEDCLCRITPMDNHVEVTAVSGCPFEDGSSIYLCQGDKLQIGSYTLTPVFLEKPKKDPTREFVFQHDKDVLVVRSLFLAVTSPEDGPERQIVLSEGRTVVGKSPSCDVVLSDPYVSARHMAIEARQGRVTLQDLGSRNGVYREDERIFTAEMREGQTVRLGRSKIVLRAFTTSERLPPPVAPIPGLIGQSEAILKVASLIHRVAGTDVTVLIEGDTGTGKEVVARALHQISGRSAGPFIPVNCGAIPKDLFESELFGHARGAFSGAVRDRKGLFALASGGTIFLDEIGELPVEVQVRLLRVLDDHRIRPVGSELEFHCDVRVVTATNRNLEALCREGKFREDLHYRLRMIDIHLPLLRERGDDIELIAAHLLAQESQALGHKNPGFTPEAVARMRAHDWPGNVRELKACIVRALVMSSPGRPLDAQELFPKTERIEKPETLEEMEKSAIRRALAEEKTRERAAKRLGIAVSTLYEKIKKYDLS